MSKSYSRHVLDKMGGCVVNSTFGITDLKDTPNTYGKEGQYLIVNKQQNGFIYQGGSHSIAVGTAMDFKMDINATDFYLRGVDPNNTQGTGVVTFKTGSYQHPVGTIIRITNFTDSATAGLIVDSDSTGTFLNLGYNSGGSKVGTGFENWRRIMQTSF